MKFLIYTFCFTILVASCKKESKNEKKFKEEIAAVTKKAVKPNIIFLLADDMGYGELGAYGQKEIQTPFLDSLLHQGKKFTDFYAGTSVCSPSRASLMTGMHTGHLSIRGNKGAMDGKWTRIPLRKTEITIPELLKEAGYQSAMIGKWHLGVPEDTSTWAKGRGFDYAVQEQWGEDKNGKEIDERVHWVNNDQDSIFYDYTKYKILDEFRTNFALDYLKNKRNPEKPYFLYMSYRIPHAHEYYISHNDLYREKGWPEEERNHAARITLFDNQVRRLFHLLKEQGELENTLIIFSSDNGPQKENHDPLFFKSSGGLKGHKRDLYEGGVREPMFAYWKGKISPGTVSKHQATFYDVLPTLAEVAGINAPEQVDGISFLPELLDQEQQKHKYLYWEIQEGNKPAGFKQAIREGDWKAVRIADSYHTELYNLANDIFETKDISGQHPEIVAAMNDLFKKESIKNEFYPYSGGIFNENN
ncbi:sulfatase-like hydrolase/transferase [Aquimarina sp. ERC-38]|uniref:sulfatase-like hydrolase/transferase n=1 Tax=Aquimarina sp. ERC-38 TaxID=2949996 RepID=UPI0022478A0A|nr:sulfatase-like hydrolase/transferase [Aquimarina sp. ERC-38]UZO82220.1 sulfatase-like hydrolase/transferase [Aquimarina sp. ERC-38]